MYYNTGFFFQAFLDAHAKSSHYMFQLKKCSTCNYCTVLQPPRVPDMDDLSFLPDPVPGENGQYLDFFEVNNYLKSGYK